MNEKTLQNLQVGVLGSTDFCRRVNAVIVGLKGGYRTWTGSLAEGWSLVLTHRPDVLIIEIGIHHSERSHAWLRKFMAQLRERFGNQVYIIVALVACEKFSFGGDLLFANEDTLEPSGFVDTFIALAPGTTPSIPDLNQQVTNAITLFALEHERRLDGRVALPPLGAAGWVQSLADPKSRELWMRWLPRYATYTNENPIIIGETGTGKTNLAYALHLLSGRKGEFIGITPRDFSSSELVQAELFGAVAGAYTGAVDKWGLVKSAEKGSLFIDELQSIDKDLQGKLITFIENKAYRRVGSAESIDADVRFIFASNRSLYDMMDSEILRHDFAYRLERVQLELQPLRQRRLDIAAALAYALAKIRRQRPLAKHINGMSSAVYRMLFAHSWPGNLRQLENSVAQLCELTDMQGASMINEQVVTEVFQSRLVGMPTTPPEIIASAATHLSRHAMSDPITTLQGGVEKFMEAARLSALEVSGGSIERAAEVISDDKKAMSLFAAGAAKNNQVESIS